jgi:hypothetical protein
MTITSSGLGGISLDDMTASLRCLTRDTEVNVAAAELRSKATPMSLVLGERLRLWGVTGDWR